MISIFSGIDELVTMRGAAQKSGRKVLESDLGFIPKAALVVDRGQILWLGSRNRLPKVFANKKTKEIHLGGETVLPAFVECHTHSLFAGSRSAEFEQRMRGASYQEIAQRGGGIRSTMLASRKASTQQLRELLQERISKFIRQGVTTLEVKTGYGLDLKNELRFLRLLREDFGLRLISTYLGAHAIPPEFSEAPQAAEAYLDFSAQKILPKIRKLTRRVDIFIERGYFNFDSSLNYLQTVKDFGFDITIHADQLSLSGGTDAALAIGARSADHLLQIDDTRIGELAASEVTCVLLPAADLYLQCAYPPARKMIDSGCRVALATDFNPGSSPTQDLALVGLLARLEMKMSLPEVISAYTVGASYALGLQDQVGSLEIAKSADFISIEKSWDQLFYSAGDGIVSRVFHKGVEI